MLDTNICVYLIKKKPEKLIQKFSTKEIDEIAISTITVSELEYGVEKSMYTDKNKIALIQFLAPFEIVLYDYSAACQYGYIRAKLEREGTIVGSMDLLIAAHAKANDLILVTNNEKEFKRVDGLKIENWTE